MGMCFRPSARLPKQVAYQFNVESGRYWMNVTGDAFEMGPSSPHEASQTDLTLNATDEQYLLFTYGRLTAAEGISSGKLTLNGDIAHLDQFEVWFKGL